jgi:aspartyl protease family protein
MRSIIVLIFALGLFASFAGELGHRSPETATPSPGQVSGDKPDRIAELTAPSSATYNREDGSIELKRQPDGHFYADVRVNGTDLRMVVDTGATVIALSRADAQSASIPTSAGTNDIVAQGADGGVHGEVARLDNVELGPLSAQDLDAIILDNGSQSLLGQNFLSKFASVQIEGDRMILR